MMLHTLFWHDAVLAAAVLALTQFAWSLMEDRHQIFIRFQDYIQWLRIKWRGDDIFSNGEVLAMLEKRYYQRRNIVLTTAYYFTGLSLLFCIVHTVIMKNTNEDHDSVSSHPFRSLYGPDNFEMMTLRFVVGNFLIKWIRESKDYSASNGRSSIAAVVNAIIWSADLANAHSREEFLFRAHFLSIVRMALNCSFGELLATKMARVALSFVACILYVNFDVKQDLVDMDDTTPIRFVMFQLAQFVLEALMSQALDHFTKQDILNTLEIERAAHARVASAESLMASLCDAHLTLDDRLNIIGDAPKLGAMLLSNRALRDTSFLELMTDMAAERFTEHVRTSASRNHAQSICVELTGTHEPIPVSLVYTSHCIDGSGQACHLIGITDLRECKDSINPAPLASGNATRKLANLANPRLISKSQASISEISFDLSISSSTSIHEPTAASVPKALNKEVQTEFDPDQFASFSRSAAPAASSQNAGAPTSSRPPLLLRRNCTVKLKTRKLILRGFKKTSRKTISRMVMDVARRINVHGQGCCNLHIALVALARHTFSMTDSKCDPGFQSYQDFQCPSFLSMIERDASDEEDTEVMMDQVV